MKSDSMKLESLPKTKARSKKRVGRGFGSGKGGHTSGRGQKGQKTRDVISLVFEGTKMRKSLIRRMPMGRGKNRFKSLKPKQIILNVNYLNMLDTGTTVDVKTLVKKGLVDKKALKVGVKILGDGELTKKLFVNLPVSKGAYKKIAKAGGKVIIQAKTKPVLEKTQVENSQKSKKDK